MMRHFTDVAFRLTLAVAATVLTPSVAAQVEQAAPDSVNSRIAKLARSTSGTWRCTESVARPDGTTLVKPGTLTIESKLDGHWLVSVLSWMPTKASPGITMIDYRTWDEGRNRWQSYAFDSGGGFTQSETTHADDNSMTWAGEDESDGRTLWWRSTEEIASSTEMTFSAEGSADGKNYVPMAHGRCTR